MRYRITPYFSQFAFLQARCLARAVCKSRFRKPLRITPVGRGGLSVQITISILGKSIDSALSPLIVCIPLRVDGSV